MKIGSFITRTVSSDIVSEEEEEDAIAGSEVGSAPGSEVGMVRTVPDVSEVGAGLVGESVSELLPLAEKLQASETNNGRMNASNGSLELYFIFSPLCKR